MIIVVKCAKCNQKYALPIESAGSRRQCKKCGGKIRVPPEAIKLRLQRFFANRRLRQACLRFGLGVVAIAGVLAIVDLQRGPTADQVRARVRRALFEDVATPGVRLWREMDNGDQSEITFDGQGRFRREYSYKSLGLSKASGFDGEVVWSKSISGTTRQLGLGSRDRTLFYAWIHFGFWTHPEAPFQLKMNRHESTHSTIAIDLELEHSLLSGTMHINKKTWKPQSFVTRDRGCELEDQYESYLKTEGGVFVDKYIATADGEEFVRETEDGKEIIAGELYHASFVSYPDDFFERPLDTAKVSFAPRVDANLQVRMGRSELLFAQARVNENDLGWFLIDTGAYASAVFAPFAEELDLNYVTNSRVSGSGGVSDATVRLADSIEIGPLRMESIPIDVIPSLVDSHLEERWAGIIGCDVLERCVVEYDHSVPQISLFDPTGYELPRGRWKSAIVGYSSPHMRVSWSGDLVAAGTFLIDTGASTLSVSSETVFRRFPDRKGKLGMVNGIGGTSGRLFSSISWLELGNQRFWDVEAALGFDPQRAGEDGYADGIIGISLLKQFKVVFDLSNHRIAFLSRYDVMRRTDRKNPSARLGMFQALNYDLRCSRPISLSVPSSILGGIFESKMGTAGFGAFVSECKQCQGYEIVSCKATAH